MYNEESTTAALKKYMDAGPHGRKVTMAEFKELSAEERNELGQLVHALPETKV